MNIPIDIPKRINPNIVDPITKSVVYYFSQNDMHIDSYGNTLYRLPYSQNTFWTNFKYAGYDPTGSVNENIEIGLSMVAKDGYKYNLVAPERRSALTWYDTAWPLPSVKTEEGGLFLKVRSYGNPNYIPKITLLGFMDLFPKTENYILLSSLDTYQFIISKYEYEGHPPSGELYSIDNCDRIREIINKVCGIRLISRY